MRHNYGTYEKSGSDVSIRRTRYQFLWCAKAKAPQITDELYKICYPLYCEFAIAGLTDIPDKVGPNLQSGPDWQAIKSSNLAQELLTSLGQWSVCYNLQAEWCLEHAVTAMRAWLCDTEARLSLSWSKDPEIARFILFPEFYPGVQLDSQTLATLRFLAKQFGIVDFEPDQTESPASRLEPLIHNRPTIEDSAIPDPPAGFPSWPFTALSRDEYLGDVERLASEEIAKSELLSSVERSHKFAYVRQVKRVAEGYCDSIKKCISTGKRWEKPKAISNYRTHLTHVNWAVRFQVQEKSYTKIAEEMERELVKRPSVSTVKRGVDAILDTIRLDIDRRSLTRRGPEPR